MKQNAKVAAILLAVLLVPSVLFAGGNAEGRNTEYEGWDEDDWHEYREHKHGRGRGGHGGRHGAFGAHPMARMLMQEFFENEAVFIFDTVVTGVVDASPAQAAGLQVGDAVLAINGEPGADLRASVQALSPGDVLVLTVARPPEEGSGQLIPVQLDVNITLGTNEEGLTFAGIVYDGFGRRSLRTLRGFDNFDLDEEDLEWLYEQREEIQQFFEELEQEETPL